MTPSTPLDNDKKFTFCWRGSTFLFVLDPLSPSRFLKPQFLSSNQCSLFASDLTPYLAKSNENLGVLYYTTGNFDFALNYFQKALKIREQNPADSLSIYKIYQYIAMTYQDQKNVKASKVFYNKALQFKQYLVSNNIINVQSNSE